MAVIRPRFEVNDVVIYIGRYYATIGGKAEKTTYITHVEEVEHNSEGRSPYHINGYAGRLGRKELQIANPELTLRYRMTVNQKTPLAKL